MICRCSAASLLVHLLENAHQIVAILAEGHFGGVRLYVHDKVQCIAIQPERYALTPVDLPRPTLQPISNVCLSEFLSRRDADPRIRKLVRGEEENAISGEKFATRLVDSQKVATLRQPPLFRQSLRTRLHEFAGARSRRQTARRFRPLRRRRESTAWPSLFRIRTRNPCVRFRRRLLG